MVTAISDNRRPHADESEGSELTVVSIRTGYAESMLQMKRCSPVAAHCHSRLPWPSCVAAKMELRPRRGTDRRRKIARRDDLCVRDEKIDLHCPQCGVVLILASSTSPNLQG